MNLLSEKFRNNFVKKLFLTGLVLITFIYTIPWAILNATGKQYSGIDFHGYWYAGHFVRQGTNSYAAIVNNPKPNYWDPQIPGSGDPQVLDGAESLLKLPIHYLDGSIVSEHPIARLVIVVPSITAPLNLFLGLFSWFSWPIARILWIIFNMTFAAVIPWIALRLIDKTNILSLTDKLLFAFTFYNFYGLRQSIVVGQQSLVCLFLLLLSLLYKDKDVLSGVFLGFGISKYSVGLPVFIYFLLQKRYKPAFIALAIQGIAILALSPLKMGSPINTLIAYYKIIAVNYAQNGVHLSARFQPNAIAAILLIITIWLVTIFWLFRKFYLFRNRMPPGEIMGFFDLNLITLAVFLTTYHRIHDTPFMVFFLLVLMISIMTMRNVPLDAKSTPLLVSASLLIVLLLIFPTIQTKLGSIPELWKTSEAATSLCLSIMFVLSLWLESKLFFAKENIAKLATNN